MRVSPFLFGLSSCFSSGEPKCLQASGQLFLGIEDSRLDRPDRDRFCRGDLVVLPFLDEAQRQRLALVRFQERHPMMKFESRRARWFCPCVNDVLQIYSAQFKGVFSVM